jgi:hypothetical protein
MSAESLEVFVDADHAAKFLFLTRRRVLELARAGKFPGHPIGDGSRRVWRFRLSELASALSARVPRKSLPGKPNRSSEAGESRNPRT